MIQIDTVELEKELGNLKLNLNDYKKNIEQLDHAYMLVKSYWQSNKARQFYQVVDENDLNLKKLVLDMESQIKVYETLCASYSSLGKNIQVNLEARELIFQKLDYLIKRLAKILSIYNRLDITSSASLSKEKREIIHIHNHLIEVKEKLKETYNSIEKIELKSKATIDKETRTILQLMTYEKDG